MRIDVWSDVICPWCWIGKHRFEQGLELMGDNAPEVKVHWHPYLLMPGASTTPMPIHESFAAHLGGTLAEARQKLGATQAVAQDDGLPMDFDRGQVHVSTLSAHRVIWLAGQEGEQEPVAEALFRAHFEHGRNLADPQVLTEAAAAGGLSAERVAALLESDEGLAEVNAGMAQARQMGIQSVPSFVINGKAMIQGAQSPEAFAQALSRAAAQLAPAP